MGLGAERKQRYFQELLAAFDNHSSVVIVSANNVGSAHLQRLRKSFRGLNATMMFGKNTLIKKAIESHLEKQPALQAVLPYVVGNCGFVFCDSSVLSKVVDICKNERVGAAAKAGTYAPSAVTIPAGPTGMEPTMTSFLQALNIATKINRGQIEIIKDVELLQEGDKVGNSEATLLQKLNIKPFSYGLKVEVVYDDGACFDAKILELTDDVLCEKISAGIRNIAAISLAVGLPTKASVPHSLINGYKNVLHLALGTEKYSFERIAELRERIDNPEKYASAAPAAASGGGGGAAAKEEEPAEEEESSEEMGFGLFD